MGFASLHAEIFLREFFRVVVPHPVRVAPTACSVLQRDMAGRPQINVRLCECQLHRVLEDRAFADSELPQIEHGRVE